MAGFKLTSLGNGTENGDAVNKIQLDTALSSKYDNTTRLNSILSPDGDVSLANQKLVNVNPGTASSDGINKSQLDTGLASKYDSTTRLNSILPPDG